MTRILTLILLLSLLAPLRASGADDTPVVMSLRECLDIALSDNPTIRVADIEIKRADYSKKETLASLLPNIGFNAAYQRSIELQTIRMDFGGESQKLKMGSDNSWNLGLSASLPLIAPTLWKSLAISDTQIMQSVETARSSRLETVNQVRQAYYSLLLAIASRQVIAQNHEIASFNADLYAKRFEQGTASEYDVLRSQVQVTNIEPELLQADIAIRQCKLQLCVLMGMERQLDIMPDVTLEQMQASMHAVPTALPSLDDNTSLRQLDLQRKLAAQSTALRKLDFLPTLAASFNVSWSALSNGNPFRNQEFAPYSNFGLSLSLPIFTGGSRAYGLRKAKALQTELDLQRDNTLHALRMQVDLAIDNMDREARQIEASRRGVDQAVKAHGIMQKSFEIGAASYLELRDSELAETSARLVYLQSIHSYLVSSAELDLLLGVESL